MATKRRKTEPMPNLVNGNSLDLLDLELGTIRKAKEPVTASQILHPSKPDAATTKTCLSLIHGTVLSKLVGRQKCKLAKLAVPYSQMLSLLKATVLDREGSSVLIMGARSTGKSLLVETALAYMDAEYPKQFITVRLSGISQTDDRMAIREMARQLDVALSEKNPGFYSGALNGYDLVEKRSISETLSSLLSMLDRSGDSGESVEDKSVAIVIVIEEFERFALHPRQTLLYNLFDLAQGNSSSPLCVIGVSSRMTTREMMEKRVRSRFSQRIITLHKPATIQEHWETMKPGLTIALDELVREKPAANLIGPLKGLIGEWNDHIEGLFKDRNSQLYKLVEYNFYTTKDVRQFHLSCIEAIHNCRSGKSDFPQDADFHLNFIDGADTQSFVESLSELELGVLISATRVQEKTEYGGVNFNISYMEYEALVKRMSQDRNRVVGSGQAGVSLGYHLWSREIARGAWEKLGKLGLLVEASTVVGKKNRKSGITEDLRMVRCDVSLMELSEILGPDHILSSWTKL